MILLALGACAPAAVLVPDDPCRLGGELAGLTADVTCTAAGSTVEARFAWDGPLRAGGVAGDGWDGLSFFAGGATAGGGGMSVGWRPGEVGFEALEDGVSAGAGFPPEQAEAPDPPWVEAGDCDADGAGEVELSGLPEAWVPGGTWTMRFDGGGAHADEVATDWTPDWSAACPLNPRAWATTRLTVTCAGAPAVEVQLLAPAKYVVEVDDFGRPADVSATWEEAFDATCGGAVADGVSATLSGGGGVLALDTTLFSATRDADGAWRADGVQCGSCDVGWAVDVEGLPDL